MLARLAGLLAVSTMLAGCATVPQSSGPLSALPGVATVDERYQSYNVEMVEVTAA